MPSMRIFGARCVNLGRLKKWLCAIITMTVRNPFSFHFLLQLFNIDADCGFLKILLETSMRVSNTKTRRKKPATPSTPAGMQRGPSTASSLPSLISAKRVADLTVGKDVLEGGSVISFIGRTRVRSWSGSWN